MTEEAVLCPNLSIPFTLNTKAPENPPSSVTRSIEEHVRKRILHKYMSFNLL